MTHDPDLDDLIEVLDDMIKTGEITPRQAKSAIRTTKAGIACAKKEFAELSPEPTLHGHGRIREKHKVSEPA